MTSTSISQNEQFSKASTQVKSSNKTRLYFVDNLRILLTVLVIFTHLAIGYGAPGDWYYNETGPISDLSAILMTLLVVINQAFFMGFFFFLSSAFSPGSLDRKGTRHYLVERGKRLGIPLIFFTMVISPLLAYARQVYEYETSQTFWQFLTRQGISNAAVGPMWFVETLLIFSIIYVLGRRLLPAVSINFLLNRKAPGNKTLLFIAFLVGLVTFIVRIWAPVGYWFEPLHLQLGHFPQYITLFALGIVAYRADWLNKVGDSQGKFWFTAVLFLVFILFPIIFVVGGGLDGDLTPYLGGWHWQSLAYAIWEQVLALGMIVALIVWFRNRFNQKQGQVAREMSGAAYATYILHTPLIILFAVSLSQIEMDLGLKFAWVAPLAVAICFFAGHIVRRLPLAREVL